MSTKKVFLLFLFPLLVSFILHLHVFDEEVIGYHVWRQSQTQTVIYHFSFTDNSIFHPQRFDLSTGSSELLYEFPLYQWLIAQTNNVMGYSVMHTRVITFLIFGCFLLGFYKVIRRVVSIEIALMTNMLLCFSPLLYYYCVNPNPDIFALCLSIWSVNFYFTYLSKKKKSPFMLFVLLLMLSALVKLPYILFGAISIPQLLERLKTKRYTEFLLILLGCLILFLPVILWYSKAIQTWQTNELAAGIFKNTKSWVKLLDYFQFHLISSVPELITNYASTTFLVFGIYLAFKHKVLTLYKEWLFVFVFFAAYFLYELNMIEKVHDYYLMPFVPLLFLVVAYGLKGFYERGYKKFIYLVLVVVPLTAWLRIDGRWNKENPGFNPDYLNQTSELKRAIPKDSLCIIDHDQSKFIALYYLKRYGFSLSENELNRVNLSILYKKGARYLLTENRNFDSSLYPEYTFNEVFRQQIKVYKLSLK